MMFILPLLHLSFWHVGMNGPLLLRTMSKLWYRFMSMHCCLQVLVDPEAAARTKLHKQERRAAGRKRKMEEMQRRRGAGVAVKNKKKLRGADV